MEMAEARTNVKQFEHSEALQQELARMTEERDKATAKLDALAKSQADKQTKLLEDHGESLAQVLTTLAVLESSTKDLPATFKCINTRLTLLERWKTWVAGIVFAFTSLGGAIGATAAFIWRH